MVTRLLLDYGSASNRIRIELGQFQNHKTIDIRKWFFDKEDSEFKRTAKGITLSLDQLRTILTALSSNSDEILVHFENKKIPKIDKTLLPIEHSLIDSPKISYEPAESSQREAFQVSNNGHSVVIQIAENGALASNIAENPNLKNFVECLSIALTLLPGEESLTRSEFTQSLLELTTLLLRNRK